MSIATTDARHVALYDSVTGIAFGPVFDDVPEADAFVRWTEHNGWTTAMLLDMPIGSSTQAMLYGAFSPNDRTTMADLTLAWSTFQLTHDESSCPWDIDRDSYGIGFRGDDYSCECECHKSGVFSGR